MGPLLFFFGEASFASADLVLLEESPEGTARCLRS